MVDDKIDQMGRIAGMKMMLILSPVAVVALAAVALFWFHHALIYRFDQTPGSVENVGIEGLVIKDFASEDGHISRVWVVTPKGNVPVVLYFPGNFSSTEASVKRLRPFSDLGYGLAVLEYRGSGGVGGTPSETAFNADARAMFDQLDQLTGQPIPANRRILHGFSLGTGIAVALANQRDVAAIVLESPFASLTDFFSHKYRGLPMNWIMWSDRYDSDRKIGKLRADLLLLRGAQDTAIPGYSFDNLLKAAPKNAQIQTYPQAGHSNLGQFGATQDILRFYQSVIHAPA